MSHLHLKAHQHYDIAFGEDNGEHDDLKLDLCPHSKDFKMFQKKIKEIRENKIRLKLFRQK
jgi:hypothetical protein